MKFFKTKKGIIITVLLCFLLIMLIRHLIAENTVFYAPPYEKTDISSALEKKDYSAIFRQTGISPAAAIEITENGDISTIEKMQESYFKEPAHKKNYIAFPVTLEERNDEVVTPIVSLKKGDILVTFNTRTLDWRHGHCGLVLDERGTTLLEHMAIGETSCITDASYWGTYPSFIVLRHKDERVGEKAADFAREKLVDIPYSIFAGFKKKDKTDEEKPSSHCSHIVWQAYKAVGVDIDSDNGIIVTPHDIAQSKELRVVQLYGVNPKKYENRLLK